MYFKSSGRRNPDTNQRDWYYRLVESYRDADSRVCHRTILNIGFLIEPVSDDQLREIARQLTARYTHTLSLFASEDPLVLRWTNELWQRILSEKKLDVTEYDPQSRKIDLATMTHSNVREIGAEWLALNAWRQLNLDQVLAERGFSNEQIRLAQTQVISRAVYPASELATTRWISQNSAVCELTGLPEEAAGKDRLYRGSLALFSIKQALEAHLTRRTNELFDIDDKVMIYDLTNTHFEGRKDGSSLAQFGRNKQKRNDARQVVLAMVVNVHGFVKYSAIFEGNYADSTELSSLLENLDQVSGGTKPRIVVIDAGIATKDNLALIRQKGHDYVCVSRQQLRDYTYEAEATTCSVHTSTGTTVHLRKIAHDPKHTDYVMEVRSPHKKAKEEAMFSQMEARFEIELTKIQTSVTKKGGIKTVEKVYERLGRIKQKYPRVHSRYNWQVLTSEDNVKVTSFTWVKNPDKEKDSHDQLGRYFLRTSLEAEKETTVWEIYNAIREVEATFRTLKNELDLRPIFHHNDEATKAHLHLGVLAYTLVNTIRYQLKKQGITHSWTEIVRIANTQKALTTRGYNAAGNRVECRKCSQPNEQLKQVQKALKVPALPFGRIRYEHPKKSVVHKPPEKTKNGSSNQPSLTG